MKKFLTLTNYLYSKTIKAQCILIPIFVGLATLVSYLFTGIQALSRVVFTASVMVSSIACGTVYFRQNAKGGNKYAYRMYCNPLSVYIAHILVVISYAAAIWLLQVIVSGFIAPQAARIEFLYNHNNYFNIIPSSSDGFMLTFYHVVGLPMLGATGGLAFARKSGRMATIIATVMFLFVYVYVEFHFIIVVIYACALAIVAYGGCRALKEEEYDG